MGTVTRHYSAKTKFDVATYFILLGESVMNAIKKFLKEEDGAAAVEYGLLVALIAAIIVATVATLGTKIHAAFTTVCTALTGGTGTC
jgi:pilus assembly protein Flp/PilA